MKTTMTLFFLLLSSSSFAETATFDYQNHKDLVLKLSEPGFYSWTSNCTYNDLYWNKETKSYQMKIESSLEEGMDLVEVKGNIVRVVSHSKNSDGTKFHLESETTLLSENDYIKTKKMKTILADNTEIERVTVIEATYKKGKYIISRLLVNGEEKPISKATSYDVWLDKEGIESYSGTKFESSKVDEEMEDQNYVEVMIKSESVCKNKIIKK